MSRQVLRTILHGDVEGFERLQDDHFASDVTDKEGWNYLHRALLNPVMTAPVEMVRRLINWGVDVNALDVYGNVPLHYAVRSKDSDVVKLLIESGADVNQQNMEEVSPFREALRSVPIVPEIVELLLRAGADLDRRRAGGISDHDYAVRAVADESEIRRLLGLE